MLNIIIHSIAFCKVYILDFVDGLVFQKTIKKVKVYIYLNVDAGDSLYLPGTSMSRQVIVKINLNVKAGDSLCLPQYLGM